MKITMIRPPAIYSDKHFAAGTSIAPAGFAYIIAALKAAGHEVKVIDAIGEGLQEFRRISSYHSVVNGLTLDQIMERIPEDTHLIGMSCMFSSEWFYDDYILHKIKEKFPIVPIVLGGEHVTAEWKNIFESNQAVDFCVLGEGEETLVELISALKTKSDLSQVKGLAYRSASGPVKNLPRKRNKKLDELAPPAWDDLPMENF